MYRANPYPGHVIWVPAGATMSSQRLSPNERANGHKRPVCMSSPIHHHQFSSVHAMSLRVAMVDASPSFANYRNRGECKLIIIIILFHMLQVQQPPPVTSYHHPRPVPPQLAVCTLGAYYCGLTHCRTDTATLTMTIMVSIKYFDGHSTPPTQITQFATKLQ